MSKLLFNRHPVLCCRTTRATLVQFEILPRFEILFRFKVLPQFEILPRFQFSFHVVLITIPNNHGNTCTNESSSSIDGNSFSRCSTRSNWWKRCSRDLMLSMGIRASLTFSVSANVSISLNPIARIITCSAQSSGKPSWCSVCCNPYISPVTWLPYLFWIFLSQFCPYPFRIFLLQFCPWSYCNLGSPLSLLPAKNAAQKQSSSQNPPSTLNVCERMIEPIKDVYRKRSI